MAAGNEFAPLSTDREITATRLFDAPRELVFQMWTDPQHIVHWWGPSGFTNTIHEMDVRPGGVWRFIMHGPDGADYPNKIVYVEIVKPEKIVYDHILPPFRVTVTFTDQGSKTKVDVRMLFETAALRDQTAREFGAEEGLKQHLGRLGDKLASLRAGGSFAPGSPLRTLVLTRLIDAPRELVFKAWIDPIHMAQWWGPKNFTNPVCMLDVRPGGSIRIDMRGPDGAVHPMTGVFHEILAPDRLVFTSRAFVDASGHAQLVVHNTVTFADDNGKTRLTLSAMILKSTPEVAGPLQGMEQGWSQSLDRLAKTAAKV